MALTFVSSTPATGSSDYFINKSLEVTFNEALDESTLTDNEIFLLDTSSNTKVTVSLALKAGDSNTVVITPVTSLRENTTHRLILVGTDQALGYQVTAANADQLAVTITVLFSTGDAVYRIDSTVEKEAVALTLEGDLFLPTNVKALGYDFTIERVRPKNHSHGVGVSLTGDNTIRFTFTKALATPTDIYDWVDIHTYSLLNYEGYLAQSGSLGVGTVPDFSVTATGMDIVVAFSGNLPNNLGVACKIHDTVQATDGSVLGAEVDYVFNTELFPPLEGLEMVKREIATTAASYYDDYIGALLFKNLIHLWERMGRVNAVLNLGHPVRKYVIASTVLDIIADKEYEKFVIAGTRRQLGDLNVSVDNLIGRLALKIAKMQEDQRISLETIKGPWQFRVGVRPYSNFEDSRTWYDVNGRYTSSLYRYWQTNIPASNVKINRQSKNSNPWWW